MKRIRDKNFESREARSKLKVSGKPYWKAIGRALHLGYRKGKRDGSWVKRVYVGNQNYKTETFARADDYADADGFDVLDFWQAQEAVRVDRPTGSALRRKPGAFTVADAVAEYLASLRGKPSQRNAENSLNAHVLPLLGEHAVTGLRDDDYRDWLHKVAESPARRRSAKGAVLYRDDDLNDPETVRKRQATASNVWGQFRAALNLAHDRRKVPPTAKEEWERIEGFKGVNVPRQRFLTVPEVRRLLNATEADFRVLVRAALETGARYSELSRLDVLDYNTDTGMLHVRKSKVGKDRHIRLTEAGRAFFQQLAVGRPGSAPLLGRRWGAGQATRLMAEASKRASLDPPIVLHGLRHTWASLALMNGASPMAVAKVLGHANTRMVERTYGHISDQFVAEEIEAKGPRYGIEDTPSNVVAVR